MSKAFVRLAMLAAVVFVAACSRNNTPEPVPAAPAVSSEPASTGKYN